MVGADPGGVAAGDAQAPAPRRRGLLGRRAASGAGESMDALTAGIEIATALRDGLAAPAAAGATRRLRGLLDADAVGLIGLDGARTWSGHEVAADALVDDVLRTDRRAAHGDVAALPLRVRDEPAGVLVVAGAVPDAAVRKAADFVSDALHRGRLESSADAAEQAELRALRAEISPHFVYNALTTIASFVRSDATRARELLLDFALYIRHNLARHGEYTTLAGEFRAVEAYLALARRGAGRAAAGAGAHRPGGAAGRDPVPRAAAPGMASEGAWADHVVMVEPAVVWALVGDGSRDPELPVGTELMASESSDGASFVIVSGADRVRRRQLGGGEDGRRPFPRGPCAERRGGSGRARARGDDHRLRADRRGRRRAVRRRAPVDRARRAPPVGDLVARPTCRSSLPAPPWMSGGRAATGSPTDAEWADARRRRRAHAPLTLDPAGQVSRAIDALRRRHRRRGAPARAAGAWSSSPAGSGRRAAGTTSCCARPRSSTAARDRRALPLTPTGLSTSGGSGRRRRPGSSRCSPARPAPARRWPPRSSPASSASTCSSSTSRRWSASTSARPRRTSSRSSTPPAPATWCCSSTRPTRCSASAPRSRTPATATPTSRCRTCCSGSRRYDGLVVLATNFEQNIDDAFLRRIHVRVEFAMPGERRARGDLGAQPAADGAASTTSTSACWPASSS